LTVLGTLRDDKRVRRPYLIIDGYNLLHAAGLARRKYGPRQLERCRAQLLAYLANHLTETERERATVVFDAAEAPPGLPRQFTAAGITIRFAAAGKDADDTIEELIAAHSAPRQVRLISSDHRLQRSAQKRRGAFIDSEDFVQELDRRGPIVEEGGNLEPEPPATGKRPGRPRTEETETDRWLKVFGEMPEAKDFSEDIGPGNSITQADVLRIQEEIDRQDGEPRKRGKSARRRI
jgi:predicted RNA-binding protein with PIN domain